MEFSIFSLLFISIITLYYLSWIFNIFILNRKSTTNGKPQAPLPPGTYGWPFIGETLDYLRTTKNGVPEKFTVDRRNKYSSDVFKTSLLGESMAFLCTPEGNKFLFSKEDKLVKSWWPRNLEKIFANSEKTTTRKESMRVKRLVRPLLKPNSLQKYIGVMDMVTKKHLKTYWDGKEVIKVHPLAKKYTLEIACKFLLNIESPEFIAKLEEPLRNISSGFISLPINLPGTTLNRAIKSSKLIKKELEKVVMQRRIDRLENKVMMTPASDDILSDLLMETYDNGEMMNDSDIAKALDGLLVGAYDNISNTLVSIMWYLAELPEVYNKVFTEQMEIAKAKVPGELLNWEDIQKMRYSWNVACEVLRLLPPVPGTFREAIADFVYEGFRIPKGFKLHWNTHATHRNPQYFPEPEKFEPSRFEADGPVPFSYVPFGGGPRMCPGNEYTRVKLLVFMHNVVNKFKWEKVFPDEKMKMFPTIAPAEGLPVRLYPYIA